MNDIIVPKGSKKVRQVHFVFDITKYEIGIIFDAIILALKEHPKFYEDNLGIKLVNVHESYD